MSLIVIQRGHVPRTSGATGAPGEQEFAREAAEQCRLHIKAVGHSTRIIDADVPSNQYGGDAFFALHYDSSRSPGACGASVGYQTSEGARVGRRWKAHYEQNGWTSGFRPDNYTKALANYYGVARAVAVGNSRAIICEAGFHSNTPDPDPQLEDSQLLASPKGPERVGIAVAATVVDLFGVGGAADCPSTKGIPSYPGMFQLGSVHPDVKIWQKQLNTKGYKLKVDGVFGEKMHFAVIDFQKKHHLVVDGVAGPATWHQLLFG